MSIKKTSQKIKLNTSTIEQSTENNPLSCSINSQQVSCSANMNVTVPPIILENLKNGSIFVDTNNG